MAEMKRRGVTVRGARVVDGRYVVDLDIDGSELLAGAIERGYKVEHDGHYHMVESISPPRLGPARFDGTPPR